MVRVSTGGTGAFPSASGRMKSGSFCLFTGEGIGEIDSTEPGESGVSMTFQRFTVATKHEPIFPADLLVKRVTIM